MAVRIGHASISENNTVNGVAGDQSNSEVCIRDFYSKPWSYLLRCKNQSIANKMVEQCIAGAQNNNIGYSQSTRNTAYTEAKKVGFNLSKITTPCNTDCSAFMTLCAVCAGVSQLQYSSNAPTTSTMVNAFMNTGLFDVCAQPELINTEQYLVKGDILVTPGKHTVMVLDDGPVMSSQRVNTAINNTNSSINITSRLPKGTHKGIDVSAYNPISNYQAVKNAGVEFAILKIIKKDGKEDSLFSTHLNGFRSVSIPISVYNYSYATTIEKAQSDAIQVINILKKYRLKCRIYLDVEDECQKNLGMNLINIINTYQNMIESSGYEFGLYTGLSFYNMYLKPYKKFLNVTYEWIARYPTSAEFNFSDLPDMSKKPDIGTEIEGWQYSSKCKINGINGYVDVNLMYDLSESEIALGIISNCNKLNFRSEPTTDSNILSVLIKGEKVSILDVLDGWYKVKYNNTIGYCSSQYIEKL